jgi:DNA-binding NarL/FixJ family response regulator
MSLPNTVPPRESPKRGSAHSEPLPPLSPAPVVRRKYLGPIRQLGDRELAVKLGSRDSSWFFLLGTDKPSLAARRTSDLVRLAEEGTIAAAASRYSRELTVSVYWLERPFSCTYTTFCTQPERHAPPPPQASGIPKLRVGVLEPDADFRQALCFWFGRTPGIAPIPMSQGPVIDSHRSGVDLLLANAYSPSLNFPALREAWRRTAPGIPVFGYSVLPSSDDVFINMGGVNEGYYLRRRHPLELLDPLGVSHESLPHSRELLQLRVRRYFQNLFAINDDSASPSGPYQLTPRENDVLSCLQKGLHDKEIASVLGISPQTVHTHLKRIFEKLGAHTRTEAVMKFLQK